VGTRLKSRRQFLLSLAGVGGAVLALSCAPAAAPTPTPAPAPAPAAPKPASAPTKPGARELIFYTGLTGPDGQIMRDMVGDHNKTGGDQVNIEIMPWVDMLAKMVATMAAGSPLDVVLFHPVRLKQFVEQDALFPMMDYLAPLGVKLDDYLPEPVKWCTIAGKLYALPMDQHQWNIWLRTDIAEKAGLDPKNPPTNRTEFMQWATKLTTKEGGNITVGGFEPGYPYPWSLTWSAIHSNGGAVYNEDWTKCIINSPEAAEAIEWVISLYDNVSAKSTNVADNFVKGVTAQQISGPWNIPGLTNSLGKGFDVYLMPTLFKKRVVTASAHSWALPRQRDQSRVEATAKFIKWMSDNSLGWAASGQIPVKKSIIESDAFKKLPYRKVFVDSIPHTFMWSNVRFYSELVSPTGAERKNFEMIITKQVSIKEGLERMQREINEVLNRPK